MLHIDGVIFILYTLSALRINNEYSNSIQLCDEKNSQQITHI